MRIGVGEWRLPGRIFAPRGDGNDLASGVEEERRRIFTAWRLLEALTDHVRPQIVGPLDLPAFYLPADRTGVMHAHNVVVSALIESAAMTGLRPAARTRCFRVFWRIFSNS